MVKKRVPAQVSPEFLEALKSLRRKVYAKGGEVSCRDLTEKIAKPKTFSKIELDILEDVDDVEKSIIRMDRRRR